MAEQLALGQRAGESGTVDGQEGPRCAPPAAMQRPGPDFLASPRLAGDQHGAFDFGHSKGMLGNAPHRLALANHPIRSMASRRKAKRRLFDRSRLRRILVRPAGGLMRRCVHEPHPLGRPKPMAGGHSLHLGRAEGFPDAIRELSKPRDSTPSVSLADQSLRKKSANPARPTINEQIEQVRTSL